MDEKTVRKYRKVNQLPRKTGKSHRCRSQPDLFEEIWGETEKILRLHPTIQAKAMQANRPRSDR